MAKNRIQVKIESILGGIAKLTHFPQYGEFSDSVNIDPSISDYSSFYSAGLRSSVGVLYPITVSNILTSTTITQDPMFLVNNPKTGDVYVYGGRGSIYVGYADGQDLSEGAISDAGEMTGVSSTPCGSAYYDNYIYFAKDTTIARYGPLDGTHTLNGNYWAGTLGKTQLTADNNFYLPIDGNSDSYPQHVFHVHSDGKLYFTDIVGGSGSISYIATKKTTVEGDTDNGSTYDRLRFGPGLIPTCMESYGENLVIALFESIVSPGFSNGTRGKPARIAIWDTVSEKYNIITNGEFFDEHITAMKNVNGTLYIASGSRLRNGYRISRYLGGYSFEQIAFINDGFAPYPGAIVSDSGRLLFASTSVYSYGLRNNLSPNALFKYNHSGTDEGAFEVNTYSMIQYPGRENSFMSGWSTGNNSRGIDEIGGYDTAVYGTGPHTPVFKSQIFTTETVCKITKISIPLLKLLDNYGGTSSITVKIYIDDSWYPNTIGTITSASYGTSTQRITLRPTNMTIDHSFYLSFEWGGTEYTPISLPIIIELEPIDVDTAWP